MNSGLVKLNNKAESLGSKDETPLHGHVEGNTSQDQHVWRGHGNSSPQTQAVVFPRHSREASAGGLTFSSSGPREGQWK